MTKRLEEFVKDIFEKAEKKEMTVEEVHLLPLALQMELEKRQWVKTPFKMKKPQDNPGA